MSLPGAWVDSLFARLSVRYGETFMRQYADLDIGAVKADWADVLYGVSGEGIGYGLRFLPIDRPPNAMQFVAICRRRPDSTQLALPGPAPKADPARVAEMMSKIDRGSVRNPRQWAHDLKAREAYEKANPPSTTGNRMTFFQKEAWRDALRGHEE
jgi:hypothetical protein